MERLIPFSPDVYVSMFARYNAGTWPAFAFAVALAVISLIRIYRREPRAGRFLAVSVASFWIWTGWAFHIGQYANLNWAATIFGVIFIAQGLATAFSGAVRGSFTVTDDTGAAALGYALMVLALALPPLLANAGGDLMNAQLFGTAPATTALIAVAALYFVNNRASLWLMIIPALWSAWELASAWGMALMRDVPLPAVTLAASAYLVLRARR